MINAHRNQSPQRPHEADDADREPHRTSVPSDMEALRFRLYGLGLSPRNGGSSG